MIDIQMAPERRVFIAVQLGLVVASLFMIAVVAGVRLLD
jgi:hypothetical protein